MFLRNMTPMDMLVGLALFGGALYLIDAILNGLEGLNKRRRR